MAASVFLCSFNVSEASELATSSTSTIYFVPRFSRRPPKTGRAISVVMSEGYTRKSFSKSKDRNPMQYFETSAST
jgi:hypothetical protein